MPGEIMSPTSVTIPGLIQSILNLVPALILLVLFVMIVYGGFVRLTAAGDADKEAQSGKILSAAVVGFVIIALAPLIINILGNLLGINTLITT